MNGRVRRWLRARRWGLLPFQEAAMAAYGAGESGLIHAPTGVGKTLAAWLPVVSEWWDEVSRGAAGAVGAGREVGMEPLRVLWVTPLRALSQDTVRALREVVEELGMPWAVEARTGDTSSARKARQRERYPTGLVTTPESLSLLLSYGETRAAFATLRLVVVDEWHELMGSKRGVQTELALARLRWWVPGLRVWGLSATLGNLEEALGTLLGQEAGGRDRVRAGRLIAGEEPKRVEIETLLPESLERFPWAGHIGLRLLPRVVEAIEGAGTTLVFTNVRSQAEIWHRAILDARPEWGDRVGIHHGSLGREARERVEEGLRRGALKAVVCTSSLDLGVDFSPVDQVMQVGGPKGLARLIQRAGRSGHRPGGVSRIVCVPTQAIELVEYAAAREALGRGKVEPRRPLESPLDVLSQHVVTVALGGGFRREELLAEVRTTRAYRNLSEEAFSWVLEFVIRGGRSLRAYPEYCRVVEREGVCGVDSVEVARMHRMSVGTIASDAAVSVRFRNGAMLGTVEESFVARLKAGQHFVFGGRVLRLVRVHQLTVYVEPARRSRGVVPQWGGGRLPLSSLLSAEVRRELGRASVGELGGSIEMERMRPILGIQSGWSRVPGVEEWLIETTATGEGRHWFLFPFGGRLVHEGLAALVAYRLSRGRPLTVSLAVNDYGLELLPSEEMEIPEAEWRRVLSPEGLLEDLLACVNLGEMARRQFRDIARVAGLVFPGYPGAPKAMRQVQASSGLFYEVFRQYEPDHLLLEQARREVLEQQLEYTRLRGLLEEGTGQRLLLTRPERLTPLSFPLWAEMIRAHVTTESWEARVRRMAAELEGVGGGLGESGRGV